MTDQKPKPPIIRRVLTVSRKEQISKNLLRVVLCGDAVADFDMVTVGINNKIFIPPPGVGKVIFPEFVDGVWHSPDPEMTPSVRTYTLRALDLERNEMSIDFALHGDGVASNWAVNASPGDELGLAMKGIRKALFPVVDRYILVADLSALPVTSVILEHLHPEAVADAIIEVPDKADIQQISTRARTNIRWIVNPEPGIGGELVNAVEKLNITDISGSRFAHVAAEFSTVRRLREYFRSEHGWTREEFHGFGYWQHGVAEERSAEVRHDESHS